MYVCVCVCGGGGELEKCQEYLVADVMETDLMKLLNADWEPLLERVPKTKT